MGLSLAKEKQVVLSLKKALNDGKDFKMQVVMMLDVSGSMNDEFRGGKNSLMESVLQRSLAFASEVDPDGKVEMVAFSDRAHHMGEMDIGAFDNATETFLKGARPVLWGSTDYASAFEAYNRANKAQPAKVLVEKKKPDGFWGGVKAMFGAQETTTTVIQPATTGKDEDHPTLIIFITDGEDYGDKKMFTKHLENQIADKNTFVLLLGASNPPVNFRLLEDAAAKFNGVDFVEAKGIQDLNNDDFYKKLMTPELNNFLKAYYAQK